MSQQIEDESYIRRYLLGEMSEEEREQVERRLLSDEDYFQQVLMAENELVYDFVCDELPEQEKMSFRQHVLPVPERREDMKFARVLRKYVRNNAPRVSGTPIAQSVRTSWLEPFAAFFRRPVVGFSLAAALLLALSISAWTAIENRRLRNQIGQLESQKTLSSTTRQDLQEQLATERQRNADLTDDLRRQQEVSAIAERNLEAEKEQSRRAAVSGTTPRTSVATVVSFLLIPGGNRGSGEGNKIPVPRGAREIRLRLDLAANNYRRYLAALKTVEGQKELFARGMLRAHTGAKGTTVSLSVPTKFLHRGDYLIQLSGATSAGQYEDIDKYYFRVPE